LKKKKFKNWLIVNDYSEHTVSGALNVIRQFEKTYTEFNQDNVYNYLLSNKNKLAKNTFNYYKDKLKLYAEFENLTIKLPKSAKTTSTIPKYIEEDYLEKEVIPVAVCTSKKPIRDKAILYFMFYTGIRPNELISLSRKNICLEKREVKIYCSKQNKERIVYISDKLVRILSAYFSYENEEINAFNIPTVEALSTMTRRVKKNIDIDEFSPYTLRHSFATHLRMNDCPLEIIQELMGHKDISSTQIYVHINNKKLKESYDKYIK